MKFIDINEDIEVLGPNKAFETVTVPSYINIETINLIRKTKTGVLSVFLIGRDKAIKISDKESITKLCKATGVRKLFEND